MSQETRQAKEELQSMWTAHRDGFNTKAELHGMEAITLGLLAVEAAIVRGQDD